MKTTTYILGAMVLGLFLLIAVGVATLYYYSTPQKTQTFCLSGEVTTRQLPACNVLKIIYQEATYENHHHSCNDYFNDSRLQVEGTVSTVPLFSFPSSLAPFFQVSQQADTVFITIGIPLEEREKHVDTPYQALWVTIRDLRLQLPSSVQHLEVSLSNMPVQLRALRQDSLFCRIEGTAIIDSCRFQSLSMKADKVCYNSGAINRLHMDLDAVREWTVQSDSCHIDTEYLQGSGYHSVQQGECRKVHWFPRNSEASLQLSLQQAAEVYLLE